MAAMVGPITDAYSGHHNHPRRASATMGNIVSSVMGAEGAELISDPLTIEVGEAGPTWGRPRRNYKTHERLESLPFPEDPSITNGFKIFERATKLYGDVNFLGEREVLEDNTRGEFLWETYGEVAPQVGALAAAMHKMLAPGGRVGVFSINRPEWTKTMLATWSQDLVCVPLYDTLGATAIEFIVNQSEVTVIFASGVSLDKMLKGGALAAVKTVVLFDKPTEAQIAGAAKQKWTLLSFTDVIEANLASPAAPLEVDPEHLAYIMYTSGTTGDPKGVMLTHTNVTAAAAGLHLTGFDITPADSYLSYLPLAHCFEACMQLMCMCGGGAIGFYQGDARLVIDDVKVLRPTIFAGVPRVYSRIYERVNSIVDKSGWVKRTLFQRAFDLQLSYVKVGQRNSLIDTVVFNKVAEQLGGRVRLMATGAAPMPGHVMDFLRVAFKCPVYQGYGMTENAAAAFVTPPGYWGTGTCGGPLPCTEVKLVDVPEMGYLSSNSPPAGEVCLRGPIVFKGYYKLDKETKETLDEDGWLHTGDVGTWETDGSLRIIDRKKNIFKLAQGEFVAAEELENVFGKSKYISQIWVYGNSFQVCLVAVIVPNKDVIMEWAAANGVQGDFAAVCASPATAKFLQDDITTLAKAAKLASFKVPKAVHVEADVNHLNQGFTVENDTLTPTFKLRRPQLLRRYQSQVDQLYAAIPSS
eukprot:m.66010 g.66010  ORF g.66010 m.66010 type:complete len:695 (-) comp7368_c1_seq2:51-2135(-)